MKWPEGKKAVYCHLVLIVIVGLLVYSNTLHVPFQFDDQPNIVENPAIKDLSYFTDPSKPISSELGKFLRRRIAGYFTFALNYRVHGFDVTGYHVVNLAIHIANALLVYLFVIITFGTSFLKKALTPTLSQRERENKNWRGAGGEGVALFTALLFVSHPVQTQAVTYVVQRLASLATMFYLVSIVTYAKWRGSRTPFSSVLYALSLLSAVLAMKTKEISFTLPVVIMLYEFMFFEGPTKKRLLRLLPFLLTMLIIPLGIVGEDGNMAEAMRLDTGMSRLDYMFTEFRVIVTYLRLLFLPVGQNLDYDYPIYGSILEPSVFLSFLLLLSIVGIGFFLLRLGHRLPAFGMFWFFIALSVESSAIPIVDVIFEHRVYLPSVGAFVAFSAGAFIMLYGWIKKATARRALLTLMFSLPLILAVASYNRNAIWQSQSSLWTDVVKKSPLKARGHTVLALVYEAEGLVDKAIEHYKTALKRDPSDAELNLNIGNLYRKMGLREKALEHYKASLIRGPHYKTYYNLGVFYMEGGELDRAIEQFRLSLSLRPYLIEAHNNLCSVYLFKGQPDEAIGHCMDALRLNPGYAGAHYNLGIAYSTKGQTDMAVRHYEEALRLKPDFLEAHGNLGALYREAGETAKAQEHLLKAEELKGALNK